MSRQRKQLANPTVIVDLAEGGFGVQGKTTRKAKRREAKP
jgi:hypothetical protein